MSNETNPFAVIFAVTAILLLITMSFAVVAPSLGLVDLNKPEYKMPDFPVLSTGTAMGNVSATWAFSETHDVVAYYNYVDYNSFNPKREVVIGRSIPPFPDYVVVQRPDTMLGFIPTSTEEPFYYMDGVAIYHEHNNAVDLANQLAYSPTQLSGQEIINNRNGTTSTFIVDKDNPNFVIYCQFSPLPGYSSLVNSWNHGNGFTVWLYGNSYQPPAWTDQVVALLSFVGQCIGFMAHFIFWMFLMSGLLISIILGVSAVLGAAVVSLIGIILVGSILMFLRGNSNK
jgi:hypothetical protein